MDAGVKLLSGSPIAHPARQLAPAQGWSRSCAPLIVITLFALAGCKGVGLSNLDTFDADKPAMIGPGISNLDTETEEEKKNQKWYDKFYGSSQGWGWETKAEKDENCKFYNNCKDDAAKADDAEPADNCGFYGTCDKKESSGWW